MSRRGAIDWSLIDPELRRIYGARRRGHLKRLAAECGVTEQTLGRRARTELGLQPLQAKQTSLEYYSAAEDDLIKANLAASGSKLVEIFRQNGFARSRFGLTCRRQQLRRELGLTSHQALLEDLERLTTPQIAELLGVSRKAVTLWVMDGLLKPVASVYMPQERPREYQVSRRALREFMGAYPAHWDSKKCNHYWLVELLMGERTPKFHRQDSCGAGESDERALRLAA